MKEPPKTDDGRLPFVCVNRKVNHSINVMTICDAEENDSGYPIFL